MSRISTLASALFVTVLCSTAFTLPTFAQPAPTLTGLIPVYLKQGEAQELTLAGNNLAGATGVVLTDAKGLTAELLKADPATKPTANRVRLKLIAAADAALGTRELRLLTPLGVTPPLVVAVGQFKGTPEREPNNGPEQAAPVAFPTSVIGKLDAGGDVDAFRFEAVKGQHLVFDVHAARLGSALEPVLVVLDRAGRELSKAISFRGGDPSAVFDVPADGSYVLLVRDLRFRGGADYAYRIDAGEIPFVESIVPATGRRGTKVEVRAVGHNLGDSAVQTVDLTAADAGVMDLRFRSSVGWSNDVPFTVTDVAQMAERPGDDKSADGKLPDGSTKGGTPANDSAKTATPVTLPAEVSGVLARAGEEDFFRFSVPTKQPITLEVRARASGSPVDALLTLRDAAGAVLEQNNGTADAEARIGRSFDPGDYVVSVRDLTFAGGPSYGYRLGLSPAGGVPADFAVRFVPDAPRVSRGSHAKVWCEVTRLNGYKGDVAVTLDGLPPGVAVSNGPAMIGEQTSGVFTLSAAADAPLGSFPIKLKAVGTFGAQVTVRYGTAELNNRGVRGAYVTVLDRPPFTVDAVALLKPDQLAAYPAEAQRLFAKVNATTPELEKALAAWEKQVGSPIEWRPVEVASASAAGGTELKAQADGSLLATPAKNPERDTYTVVASAGGLKQVAAVRLEVLPDPSFPQSGPGRASSGNFALTKFTVAVAPKGDPGRAKLIPFAAAKATYEQADYDIHRAIDDKPEYGWAIFPGGVGKPQSAWFFPAQSVALDPDAVLTFTLDQQYGEQHTIGRFRLSVTDDPEAKTRQGDAWPPAVAATLKVPAEQRSAEQKAQLAAYYRSIAPELRADRARLDALRNTIGPYAEVARLEAALNATTPALDAERKEWEQSAAAGTGWTPVGVTAAKAVNGTVLVREPDGSVVATGPAPATEVYTVTATTPLRAITAVRLEALSDERLPGNGPGRASDGNFVLTRFAVAVAPAKGAKPTDDPARVAAGPVALRDARASFEQANYPAAAALDDRPDTGWAVSPMAGRPHVATFVLRAPIVAPDGGAALTFTLAFDAPNLPGFSLGRFRLSVLGAADPATAAAVPPEIVVILNTPPANRGLQNEADLAAYHRSISPTLEPTRRRLADLRRALTPLPVTVPRDKTRPILVPIARLGDFAGPVAVTLEGFTAGRDPQTRQPASVRRSIDVVPATVAPDASFARLMIRPLGSSELGTRMVVLRAEAKIGNDTFVQYSPAFTITITDK